MNTLLQEKPSTVLLLTDFIQIRLEPALSLLTVEWKRQIAYQERLAGYRSVYEFLKKYRAENILINNEKIFLFTPQEKAWLAATLSKWVSETDLKRLALVTSDVYKNMTDLSDFIGQLKKTYHQLEAIEHEFFIDQATARCWLKQQIEV